MLMNPKRKLPAKQLAYYNDLMDTQVRLVDVSGLACTGKTYLAIKCAMRDIQGGFYEKLVLVREPIISACGMLPGDYDVKMNPYVSQSVSYAGEVAGQDVTLQDLVVSGRFEITEPGLLQGNRLSRCIVIFDEAQNIRADMTYKCLSRGGEGTKFVVISDLSTGQEHPKVPINKSLAYYVHNNLVNAESMKPYATTHTFYSQDDVLGDAFTKALISAMYDDFVHIDETIRAFNS